jgi:hypothetical protein
MLNRPPFDCDCCKEKTMPIIWIPASEPPKISKEDFVHIKFLHKGKILYGLYGSNIFIRAGIQYRPTHYAYIQENK